MSLIPVRASLVTRAADWLVERAVHLADADDVVVGVARRSNGWRFTTFPGEEFDGVQLGRAALPRGWRKWRSGRVALAPGKGQKPKGSAS